MPHTYMTLLEMLNDICLIYITASISLHYTEALAISRAQAVSLSFCKIRHTHMFHDMAIERVRSFRFHAYRYAHAHFLVGCYFLASSHLFRER